jgi:hypothetical protein
MKEKNPLYFAEKKTFLYLYTFALGQEKIFVHKVQALSEITLWYTRNIGELPLSEYKIGPLISSSFFNTHFLKEGGSVCTRWHKKDSQGFITSQ